MKKFLPFIISIVMVILIITSLFGLYQIFKSKGLPKEPKKEEKKISTKQERQKKQKVLIDLIKEIFQTESPNTSFSLGVYDLKNKEYFGYNDEAAQHAASVSKVLTAVILLDKIEKGEIKLSDPMGAYNVEFQLEKMINISNQDSWDLIDAKLGIKPQEEYAKNQLGLPSVDLVNNNMSVKDVTMLLKKLANEEILSDASRMRLFDYMQNTESEDFFSPVFNEAKLTFYHKTGKYEGEGHDAAIVLHKKYPFVLVLFTQNNTSPNLLGRGTIMQKTAEAVLEYFDFL